MQFISEIIFSDEMCYVTMHDHTFSAKTIPTIRKHISL